MAKTDKDTKTAVITAGVTLAIKEAFGEWWKEQSYATEAEAIRALVREKIDEHQYRWEFKPDKFSVMGLANKLEVGQPQIRHAIEELGLEPIKGLPKSYSYKTLMPIYKFIKEHYDLEPKQGKAKQQ